MTDDKLSAWASTVPQSAASASNGSDTWAQRYWWEIRDISFAWAARMPRSLQRHLGPSELGHECDRLVIGKMAGHSLGGINHVSDPWASMVGTAIHEMMEKIFTWHNTTLPEQRWDTERRVTPDPGAVQSHPGTGDLYDRQTRSMVDWKAQSESVRAQLRSQGPPPHYFWQLMLYAVGYMLEGFVVDRIVLVSLPRTKSSIDDGYVWAHTITNEDLQGVIDLLDKTATREKLAVLMQQGELKLMDIPATPSDASCHYCPFYRPQAAYDPDVKGCPGSTKGPYALGITQRPE
jgi:hypothetical protein